MVASSFVSPCQARLQARSLLERIANTTATVEDVAAATTFYKRATSPAHKFMIAALLGLALHNALETIVLVVCTVSRRCCLFSCSVLITLVGIIASSTCSIATHFAEPTALMVKIQWAFIGSILFTTGQPLVLLSRLYLLVESRRAKRCLLVLVVGLPIAIHIPVVVLYIVSHASSPTTFSGVYRILKRVMTVAFFVQDLVLASVYITKALELRASYRTSDLLCVQLRSTLHRLIAMAVFIIAAGIASVILDFSRLHGLPAAYKSYAYSAMLKFEVPVLASLPRAIRGKTILDSDRVSSQAAREWEENLRRVFGPAAPGPVKDKHADGSSGGGGCVDDDDDDDAYGHAPNRPVLPSLVGQQGSMGSPVVLKLAAVPGRSLVQGDEGKRV